MTIAITNPSLNSVARIDLLPQTETTCFILKGLFSNHFCEQLKNNAIKQGFCKANDKYPNSYRNNQRLVEDNKTLAQSLYLSCKPYLPNTLYVEDSKLLIDSLNERLRYCKYSKQQQFSIHRDGVFYREANKQSVLTFLLYLNNNNEFLGGETAFYKDQYGKEVLASYTPEVGDVAIFDHTIWHSGNKVYSGSKYILRSDFIYSKKITVSSEHIEENKKHHNGYIWKVAAIDKQLLASASRDKTIKIWDKQFNCIQTLKKHQNSVFDISVDTHKNLYAVSRDGYMTKWTKNNGQYSLAFRINTLHPSVLKVLVLENGSIITSGSDGAIRLWNKTQQIALLNQHKGWVWSLIGRDHNAFISCDSTGEIIIWDSNTQKVITQVKYKDSTFRCMAMHNSHLFLGDEKGQITQLNAHTLEHENKWQTHKAIVRDIISTEHGIVSCGEDNKVVLTSDNRANQKELFCHSDFATSLCLTTKKTLVSSSYSGRIECIKLCD